MRSLFRSFSIALSVALVSACGGNDGGGPSLSAEPLAARVEPMTYAPKSEASTVKRRKVQGSPRPHVITIGAVSLAEQTNKTSATPRLGAPQKIGFSRDIAGAYVSPAARSLWQWQPTANGGWVASISVTSKGATGVRLALQVRRIPWDAVVRVYAQNSATAFEVTGTDVLATIHRNVDAQGDSDATRTYWTPPVDGEESTVEVELGPGTPKDALAVTVPRLSHLYASPSDEKVDTAKIGQAASCEVDVSCSSGYSQESNATAKMSFVASDGGNYVCTGTLLNDRQGSGMPYFLSANHCISLQSEASTLITYWFYRSNSCNSNTLNSGTKTVTGGATLLYASASTDTSFMRLNTAPPSGVNFAGWDSTAPAAGTSLVGIHHPSGDLQKISTGSLKGFRSCTALNTSTDSFSCSNSTQTSGNFVATQWSRGVTEAGSSGSGLYKTVNGTNYLIGQLYGGSSSCSTQTATDDYGRFDVAYSAALSRWLDAVSVRNAVFRFYNTQTGAHFFTISSAERDSVIASFPQYLYEGAAFYAYPNTVSNLSPVFRFYNATTRAHFYTISAAERDSVIKSYPVFAYEGPKWYAQTVSTGLEIPVFRFYNQSSGAHFYTVSASERDYVIQTLPTFKYEGVAYYAWNTLN